MPPHAPCPRCGQIVLLTVEDRQTVLRCRACREKFLLYSGSPFQVPDNLELEERTQAGAAGPWHAAARGLAASPAAPRASGLHAVMPAAPPLPPKDPDKALTSFALGMFRVRGWPCQELEGYRAFEVRLGFPRPEGGGKDICKVSVSASGGVLTFETLLLPLPAPPWLPVREALNALNARSGGSVFLLRESGVVARHKALPRLEEHGAFSVQGLFRALRQLHHDRRLALPVLEAALRDQRVDHLSVERAFSAPVAPGAFPPPSVAQLQDLAGFAGYHTLIEGSTLGLSREPCSAEDCRVRVSVAGGVLRGWTVLEEERQARRTGVRGALVRHFLRHSKRIGPQFSHSLLGRLLERLNVLNDSPGLLRYLWSHGRILAMAVHSPVEAEMKVEEFTLFAEALFRCASEGAREIGQIRQAV